MADHVLEETRQGVRFLTLNKPEILNAFDRPMLLDLIEAVQRAAFDRDVRVIVLKGSGRAFCAGGDLRYVNELRQSRDHVALAEFGNRTEELMTEIAMAGKPVIAQVGGAAYAGGLIIVLMADLTIASPDASFCAIQARRGLLDPYVVGRLIGRVGVERAKRLVFTSAPLEARRAQEIGLVSEVVDADDIDGHVSGLADELAAMPNGVLRVFKQMFNEFAPQYQMTTYRANMATEEARTGVAAFVDRNEQAGASAERG